MHRREQENDALTDRHRVSDHVDLQPVQNGLAHRGAHAQRLVQAQQHRVALEREQIPQEGHRRHRVHQIVRGEEHELLLRHLLFGGEVQRLRRRNRFRNHNLVNGTFIRDFLHQQFHLLVLHQHAAPRLVVLSHEVQAGHELIPDSSNQGLFGFSDEVSGNSLHEGEEVIAVYQPADDVALLQQQRNEAQNGILQEGRGVIDEPGQDGAEAEQQALVHPTPHAPQRPPPFQFTLLRGQSYA